MTHPLINPADPLERQNEKLIQISEALMRRVEQDTDRTGAAYATGQPVHGPSNALSSF